MFNQLNTYDIIGPVCSSCEICEIELNLIPSVVQPHRHCANKRFYPCCRLIIGCSEPTSYILIIKYLERQRKKNVHLKRFYYWLRGKM